MKPKAKKSYSLSLVHGKAKEFQFYIGGDPFPTVKEEPVKSMGHWYTIPLTYHQREVEVEKQTGDGVRSDPSSRKVEDLVFPIWPSSTCPMALSGV